MPAVAGAIWASWRRVSASLSRAGDLDAGHDHGIGHVLAAGDAQAAAVVEPGAAALFGGVELVHHRVVDHRGDDLAVALERDGDRKERDRVEEVGGAVERIDDPAVLAVGALHLGAFLAEEAVGRAGLAELGEDDLLGALVGVRDEVGRALARDLEVLDLAEILGERAAGLDRGLDHDVEEGGAGHAALS